MLTCEQQRLYENVQKVCTKIILGSDYVDYPLALKICSLSTLFERREKRVLEFSLRSLKHPKHTKMFPVSTKYIDNIHDLRAHKKFEENFAYGEKYYSSFIPYAQRMLNRYISSQ